MKKIDLMREQSSVIAEENVVIEHENVSKYEPIDESPFTAIQANNKWIIVMGDEIASGKKFDSLEELEEYIESKPWELIVTASNIFQRIIEKNKELEKKTQKGGKDE